MQQLLKVHRAQKKLKHTNIFKGDDHVQWEQCREKLSKIISLKCRGFGLDKVIERSSTGHNIIQHLNFLKSASLFCSPEKRFIAREEALQSVVIMEKNVALLDTLETERK